MRRTYLAPLLGLALVLGPTALCTPSARAADQPASAAANTAKAEEIIAKSIGAVGGEAALNKLKSRVTKASAAVVGQEIKGSVIEYMRAPNLFCGKADFGAAGFEANGFNGTVYWQLSVFGPRILEGAERAQAERMGRFNSDLFWRDYYQSVTLAGEEDLNGQACYKLQFAIKGGGTETRWYDKKTYLQAKTAYIQHSLLGDNEVEVQYGDHRKVDGVVLPFRFEQSIGKGLQRVVITVDSIEHNTDIPDEQFKLPPEIQELVNQPASKPTQP